MGFFWNLMVIAPRDSSRVGSYPGQNGGPRLGNDQDWPPEKIDDLLRRIGEASAYFPMEHLAISLQRGFATFFEGNPLSWEQQRRKLELVVETARPAWG